MTAKPGQSEPAIAARLEAAAERVWGAERLDALRPSLARAAQALAAVEAFPLPEGTDPFPPGPHLPGQEAGGG